MIDFSAFLTQQNIRLHKGQMHLCELILTGAENNPMIGRLLYGGAQSGKSFVFHVLDAYFAAASRDEIEIPDTDSIRPGDQERQATGDPSVWGTDEVGA